MIHEATTRAWAVTTKPVPPSRLQYFNSQVDGVTAFYTDYKKAVAFTFNEARHVVNELEAMFALRGDKFQIVYLGDVCKT